MDHAAVYNRLISRARGRVLEGYSERHHVIPRCIGGTDKNGNLVQLTPEEHFVAHQLLVFIYPDEPKMALALKAMSMSNRGKRTKTNKLFGWMRRRVAEARRQVLTGRTMPPEQGEKISKALKGRKHEPERTAKKRATLLARLAHTPPKRNPHSEETKARMKAAQLGREYNKRAGAKLAAFNASKTPEEMTARTNKAWATKRAKSPQLQLFPPKPPP